MTYLTEEELEELLSQISERHPTGKRNLALLWLMADAGLRVSEAVAVQTADLEYDGGQLTHVLIRNGKGGKPGKMPLSDKARVTLGRWLEARADLGINSGYVFCTISRGKAAGHFAQQTQILEPGKPVSRVYVWGLVKRLADRAGLEKKVSPHVLRHTFANRLLKRGRNLAQVQKAMRHSKIATTVDIYGHLDQEDVEAAVGSLNGPTPEETARVEVLGKIAYLENQLAAAGPGGLASRLRGGGPVP